MTRQIDKDKLKAMLLEISKNEKEIHPHVINAEYIEKLQYYDSQALV